MNLKDISGLRLKSLQTGLLDTDTVSTGTAPEIRYVDVTITAVDTSKAFVIHDVQGYSASSGALTGARAGQPNTSYLCRVRAYLLNSTTIRFYHGGTSSDNAFSGRWQVVEFA